MENVETKIEVLKRKASSLFSPEDRLLLFEAVNQVHDIVSTTTLLVKAWYLEQLEQGVQNLEINDELIEVCIKVIQENDKLPTRTTKPKNDESVLTEEEQKKKDKTKQKNAEQNETKKSYFETVKACYDNHFNKTPKDDPTQKKTKKEKAAEKKLKPPKLSLSHILAYSKEGLLTAYKNNVVAHYPKYVKRYILYALLERQGVERVKDATKPTKEVAYQLCKHLLYDEDLNDLSIEMVNKLSIQIPTLKTLLVPNIEGDKILDYKLKANNSQYLEKMVFINQQLEVAFQTIKEGKKLYCPLVLVKSFVPNHIRLDTSCLIDLFVYGDRMKEFQKMFEREYSALPNLKGKSDVTGAYDTIFKDCKTNTMAEKYKTLLGVESVSKKQEEALFATEMWKFLTKIGTNKKYEEIVKHKRKNGVLWVFDNAIVTDGFSASFQITPFRNLKRKKKEKSTEEKPKKKTKKEKLQDKKDEFLNVASVSLDRWSAKDVVFLSCDPGKGELMTVTDGVQTISYSSGQRNRDTQMLTRRKQNLKVRSDVSWTVLGQFDELHDPLLSQFESDYLSKTSHKSCVLSKFLEYVKRRFEGMASSKKCYKHPMFRHSLLRNKRVGEEIFKQDQLNVPNACRRKNLKKTKIAFLDARTRERSNRQIHASKPYQPCAKIQNRNVLWGLGQEP